MAMWPDARATPLPKFVVNADSVRAMGPTEFLQAFAQVNCPNPPCFRGRRCPIIRQMLDRSITSTDVDYLSTPAVAAYFDAREHETYYAAIKRAEQRRDFHERLLSVLELFIELTNSEKGVGAVDR